jgi:hypothetical protein
MNIRDAPHTSFHHPSPNIFQMIVDVLVAFIITLTRHLREPPQVQALAGSPQNVVLVSNYADVKKVSSTLQPMGAVVTEVESSFK